MTFDTDYYEWKQKATSSGLINNAAFSYYIQDSKYLYSVFIDKTPVTAPVFTFRRWLKDSEVNEPLGEFNIEDRVEDKYADSAIEELARQIAFEDGIEDLKNIDISKYLWNAPVYAITNVDRDEMKFDITISDYFSTRNTGFTLEEELAKGLYRNKVEPDTEFIELRDSINKFTPEYRNKFAETFDDVMNFGQGYGMAGGSAMVFFKVSEDEYVFPIIRNSTEVSKYQGWLTPAVTGVFQPYRVKPENAPEPSLRTHYLKEFSEIFFDIDPRDSIENVQDIEEYNKLEEILTTEDGVMRHTSVGIDCKTTNVQFNGVMTIDDIDYFKEYIKPLEFDSWEYEHLEFVSTKDEDRMKELFHRSKMTPYNIVCLSEGLRWLENNRSISLPFELRESSSHRHSKK